MISTRHACLPLCLYVGLAASAQPQAMYTALLTGHADEAAREAQQALAANPNDAQAHQVLCRVDYSLNQTEAAVNECQAAVAAGPASSQDQMWLGRALGQKAEHASMFTAMGVAKRVHLAFERAVQLDPGNLSAAGDLGEFYIAAPGIVGGGQDKLARLAATLLPAHPAVAHRLLGLSAEKAGDLGKAEAEFKLAGKAPDALVDLANFYRRHNRLDECVAAIKQALPAARGPVLVDAASILTDANRNPELAEQALRDYLKAPAAQNDGAPAFRVEYQLGRLLDKRGDHAAAQAEYNAALALAVHFEPARKAVAGR